MKSKSWSNNACILSCLINVSIYSYSERTECYRRGNRRPANNGSCWIVFNLLVNAVTRKSPWHCALPSKPCPSSQTHPLDWGPCQQVAQYTLYPMRLSFCTWCTESCCRGRWRRASDGFGRGVGESLKMVTGTQEGWGSGRVEWLVRWPAGWLNGWVANNSRTL